MIETDKRFRFNKREIDRLPPQERSARAREAEYSDSETTGLKLLVSKNGRKFYYFRFTRNGRRRAVKIGEHGPMSVQDARRRAGELRALLDRGEDPQQGKVEERGALTLRDFSENEYLPHARANKRSHADDESKLRLHILPKFGDRPLTVLTTKELQTYHNGIRRKRCPATANRHMSLIHRMLKLAVDWGHMMANPADGIKMHRENNARHRYLSGDEVGRFFAALKREKNRPAAALIAFLLLTGTRRGEALNAKWKDIDMDKGVWYIPTTKGGKSRHAILNGRALGILKEVERVPGNPYVFTGKVAGKPINNPMKAFRRVMADAGIEGVRPHDLRHSYASLAVNSGVSLYEVQHLLGHASHQTTQRYAHMAEGRLREASAEVASAVDRATAGLCEQNDGTRAPP